LVKLIIEKYELFTLKPKKLLSNLRDRKEISSEHMPSKTQLSSFAATLRKKVVEGYLKNNLSSLKDFIDLHSFEKSKTKQDLICLEWRTTPESFSIVMTSKDLLENLLRQKQQIGENFIYLDATYKLMQNRFILLTMGTENINHNFRFVACAIVSHEDTFAYEYFLLSIKKAFKCYYNFNWNPSFAISDAANCISNALKKVFPNIEHLRCYFHTIKAVKDKIQRYKNGEEKNF